MVKRVPAQRPNRRRVVHYVNPATPPATHLADLANLVQYTDPDTGYRTYLTPAQFIAQKQRDAVLLARWKERRRAQRERDRKIRRFWLGFGAILAVALLAGLVLAVYLIWQALAAISLSALAIPVVLLLAAIVGVGGHKCVTVVQHWH